MLSDQLSEGLSRFSGGGWGGGETECCLLLVRANLQRSPTGVLNHGMMCSYHLLCFYGTCMGMALAIDAYAQRKHMLLFIKQANSLADTWVE
eukprot:scaffold2757_cov105-Skeletonema_marinoi.AAC.4